MWVLELMLEDAGGGSWVIYKVLGVGAGMKRVRELMGGWVCARWEMI